MAKGGARPNSGPAKGAKYAKTLSREEMKQVWRDLAKESLRDVMASHIRKCLEGDTAAIKEFNERLMGKVVEEIDHTSGGKPIFLPSQLMDKYKLNDTDKSTGGDSK